jgi:phosphomannomutase
MEREASRQAFKAYDIRGRVPDELSEELAYCIGRTYAQLFKASKVALGRDIRQSSVTLSEALAKGLLDEGCSVLDIGLCGTEQIYFASSYYKLDGGIMVTASHNPIDYNGMKLVREDAKPVSGDSGLRELEERVISGSFAKNTIKRTGRRENHDCLPDYVSKLLTFVDLSVLLKLKVVVNPGNGCAGPVLDSLTRHLPFEFIQVNYCPDCNFPNGIPNPLLPENREATAKAVREAKADVGIAWDGDFDRCFLFDEEGNFIEGYYIVGFLAQAFLRRFPGAKIIHDPRLTWNTIEMVQEAGGTPVQSKTGHAFIKERMRLEDAVYGGEMSAHHYFRDFAYCDSGMIPWLLILEAMCREGKKLSQLVGERINRFPCSGEINRRVHNPAAVMKAVEKEFSPGGRLDRTDGLSVEHERWRFNLRMSNTEPLLRLNVETRMDQELLKIKTKEILDTIDA